ncbi:MAG TPA: chemotaxis protein CheB, partial [Bryobacteraceae bacterium]|nr:chemotaxis protein CheB [Bryobacteraceae bacterium]
MEGSQKSEAPGQDSRQSSGEQIPERVPVVGIGASAGGLDAVLQLLRALPADTGLAFVYIQHLDPAHESKLPEILRKATSMPVREAKDETPAEANTFYVIPANTALKIENGALKLEPRADAAAPHFLIDRFLCSLAEDCGSQAIGVILSGTGSDGTEGLKAVKEGCGITFAQSEASSKYSGMPLSAIAGGAADFVLPPKEIAAELARIGQNPAALRKPAEGPVDGEEDALKRIFSLLHNTTKVNFSNYKRSTVRRRIGRRMVVHKLADVSAYANFLGDHPGEVSELFRDILIHVTAFFREPASFGALTEALAEQMKGRNREEPFRVWVAGCATGEEVYSIAICLDEFLGSGGHRTPLQMFGTDISEKSLVRARKGIYSDAIATEVSPERLTRYFVKVDEGYQIIKSIRDACVFARHDLTTDPPFSRLDLISCRNVLIYMGTILQLHIVKMFHYGLKPSGLLMLGSAEAIPSSSDLFLPISREYKIYQKNPAPALAALDAGSERMTAGDGTATKVAPVDLQTLVQQAIQNKYSVDGVVITRDMQIVMFMGHTGLYIDPAPGGSNFNLVRMIREELAFKVQAMVFSAIDQNTPVGERGIRLVRGKDSRQINVEVIPLPASSAGESYLLILFEEVQETPDSDAGVSSQAPQEPPDSEVMQRRVGDLESDLSEARALLRSRDEEHEASVEELRASNEEVRSSNEELQSTNEELGTTKEELQSVNEELTTLNEELRHKNSELGSTNDDLKNLFSAANLPILMVDNELRIRRFTPSAESLLNLIPADVGRLVNDLRGMIEVPHLLEMLRKATDDLVVSNIELQVANRRWYAISCRPYRTMDNRIDGAVITFVDIDSLKQTLKTAQHAQEYAEGIVATVAEPLIVLNSELRVQHASPSFYRAFQVSPQETEGTLIYELGNGQWNIPRLRVLLESILPRNTSFQDFEVEHTFPHIGFRSMRLNARRIRYEHEGDALILLAIEDVTDRREAAEVRYRRLFETAKDGILVLNGDNGEIIDVNPHFLQMCLCHRTELMGKQLWETGVFELSEPLREIVERARREDLVRLDSLRVVARDGKKLDVDMVANRYTVAGSNVIQCNIRDVTERKRAENEVRRSNEDLQQYAYAASHDLQEPLRTVRSYTQIIVARYQPVLDEEGRQLLSYVQTASERMSELIKDLLTYSQINAATVRLEPVNSETVLGWTVVNLQMAIADSDAIVTNDPLPIVRIDQMQLVQVF